MWFSRFTSKRRYRKLRKNFKVGDRVRVLITTYSPYLQKGNQIGIIANDLHEEEFYNRGYGGFAYCLYMDKPVKYDPMWRAENVTVPDGCAYFVTSAYDLELVEPVEFRKPFDIWAVEPPETKPKSRDERVPEVWKDRVLANSQEQDKQKSCSLNLPTPIKDWQLGG